MAVSSKLSIYAFIACASLLPSCLHAEMVETLCAVDNRTADIFFITDAEIGDLGTKRYSISFQDKAIAMRFQPMYYALHWQDVDSVIFEISHKSDDAGRLSIREHKLFGISNERIGIVQRSCWEQTKQFLMKSKIKVRISEPPGAPG